MSARIEVDKATGFEAIERRVDGGTEHFCDGMPRPQGCGDSVIVARRWSRVGTKSTGWLVAYAVNPDGTEDRDIVLAFCPSCVAVVRHQTPTPTEESDHG